MSLSFAPQVTSMSDLLPRLEAVLTAARLTGRDARLGVRPGTGGVGFGQRAARVEMPFSAVEIALLVEAVERAARRERDPDFAEVSPYIPPSPGVPF